MTPRRCAGKEGNQARRSGHYKEGKPMRKSKRDSSLRGLRSE
jgi:hypothetical protein